MTTKLDATETVKPAGYWEIAATELSTVRPDGSQTRLIISPYVRTRDNALHLCWEQNGISYDVPTDGDFNLIICSDEDTGPIPLAAASMQIENGAPVVTMIQRVKSRIERDDTPPPQPGDLIRIMAVYDLVPHPKVDLLQGENKIEWFQILLDQCCVVAKKQGYDGLKLQSGFATRYGEVGHNLSLAVQQYDFLVNRDPRWIPVDEIGDEIIDGDRDLLSKIIKRIAL